MQAEGYSGVEEATEAVPISQWAMIHDADYKAVLLPDTIRIGLIVLAMLISMFAIRAVIRSTNKYAGVILLAFMLALAGICIGLVVTFGQP